VQGPEVHQHDVAWVAEHFDDADMNPIDYDAIAHESTSAINRSGVRTERSKPWIGAD